MYIHHKRLKTLYRSYSKVLGRRLLLKVHLRKLVVDHPSRVMNIGPILASKSRNLSLINLLIKMSGAPPSRGLYTPPNRRQNRPNRRGKPYAKPDGSTRDTKEVLDGPATTLGAVRAAATATAAVSRPYENGIQNTVHRTRPPSAISRPETPGGISQTRFTDFVDQGKIAKSLLVSNPYEFCTEVQAQTMGPIIDGFDV
jgi:hypothetical protein